MDYQLFGDAMEAHARIRGSSLLSDHRLIKLKKDGSKKLFKPLDAKRFHEESINHIKTVLKAANTKKQVVVSHHAPSFHSVAEAHRNDLLPASFASDLTDLIEAYQPDLWIQGHMHNSSDYHVGKTRVVCNPRGYNPFEINPNFINSMTVEI